MVETAGSRFRQAMVEAAFHRFARRTGQRVCEQGCHDDTCSDCGYCKARI